MLVLAFGRGGLVHVCACKNQYFVYKTQTAIVPTPASICTHEDICMCISGPTSAPLVLSTLECPEIIHSSTRTPPDYIQHKEVYAQLEFHTRYIDLLHIFHDIRDGGRGRVGLGGGVGTD